MISLCLTFRAHEKIELHRTCRSEAWFDIGIASISVSRRLVTSNERGFFAGRNP